MILTNLAVEKRVTVFVLAAIIVIAGTMSYISLPRESAPDVEVPQVTITTMYRGVSPEDMEQNVTIEIEKKLKGLDRVKSIKSISAEGRSSIVVEFITGTDIHLALQKVKDEIDKAKKDLPADLDDDPVADDFNFSEVPIMVFTLSGQSGLNTLRDIADDLQDEIEGVPGVMECEVAGGLVREIHIEVDPDRMTLYGIPFGVLQNVVSNENANISGGSIRTDEGRYQIRLEGEFASLAEVEGIVLAERGGMPIYLRDVAAVSDSFEDLESVSRMDGVPCVTLQVKKRAGENIIRITDDIKKLLDERSTEWPAGTKVTILHDSSNEIRNMIADLENNILSGLALVIVVICFALGLRNAILISLSIPFSMLLAFVILSALGVTLNMVVLFSLTLALGMLVDNAIVIIENIYRFMQQGVPRVQAAMRATSEVAWPIIGSSLTTIGAFFPLLFWSGIMGGFMKYIPITVITTLGSCLFVALAINPAMAAVLLKPPRVATPARPGGEADTTEHPLLTGGGRVLETYRRLLRAALGTSAAEGMPGRTWDERAARKLVALAPRFAVLATGVLLLFLCISVWVFWVGLRTPTEFFPSPDPESGYINFEMPEGSDLAYRDEIVRQTERLLFDQRALTEDIPYAEARALKRHASRSGEPIGGPSDFPSIEHCYSKASALTSGSSFFGGQQDDHIGVFFHDYNDRPVKSVATLSQIGERLAGQIAGAKVTVEQQKNGPPTGAAINIEISGPDFAELGRLAGEVREMIRVIPFVQNIRDDYTAGASTLKIRVDRQRAKLLGLDNQTIGFVVKAAINGIEVSTYRVHDDDYDIIVRFRDDARHKIETLRRLFLPTAEHGMVPLTTVAEVDYEGGLGEITRIDHRRVVTVKADVDTQKTTGTTARTQAEAILKGSPLFQEGRLFPPGKRAADLRARVDALPEEAQALLGALGATKQLENLPQTALAEKERKRVEADLVKGLNRFIESFDFQEHKEAISAFLQKKAGAAAEAGGTADVTEEGRQQRLALFLVRAEAEPEAGAKVARLLLETLFPDVLLSGGEGLELPAGYRYVFTGENEFQQEAQEFLTWAGLVAVALIFLILVAQFNSVINPFIILSSVVLSLAGVFLGLAVWNLPFGIIMSGVGVISLAGVVVNNAIVLLDYTLQLRRRGLPRDDAIVAAGSTRLRPVLLTAITTILGLVPMATGWSFDFHTLTLATASESSEWWRGMAVPVIFGLMLATLLTLVVVPVLYSLFDDLSRIALRAWERIA